MTSEEGKNPNFSGISNKMQDVANTLEEEKSLTPYQPRRSKNVGSKSINKCSPFIIFQLICYITIENDIMFIPNACTPSVLRIIECIEKDMKNMWGVLTWLFASAGEEKK